MDNNLTLEGFSREELLAYHCSLARRGSYIQYDCCGNDSSYPASDYSAGYQLPSDRERVEALVILFEQGFGSQVLLSQDICKKTQLVRYGGIGYAHILASFVSQLRDAGFEDEDLQTMLVHNPRKMLVPR
jgi:phosphotriesterase-related protein